MRSHPPKTGRIDWLLQECGRGSWKVAPSQRQ